MNKAMGKRSDILQEEIDALDTSLDETRARQDDLERRLDKQAGALGQLAARLAELIDHADRTLVVPAKIVTEQIRLLDRQVAGLQAYNYNHNWRLDELERRTAPRPSRRVRLRAWLSRRLRAWAEELKQ